MSVSAGQTWTAVVTAVAVTWPAAAAAQITQYPIKPMRIVVPLPPAGSTDIVARLVAQKFNEAWGQPVIVDNRPGAGTTLGSELVARAAPDGYTMLLTSSSLATSVSLYRKMSFDPVKDLSPIGPVGQSFYVLAVHPSFPAASVREFIALAKAKPGQILYASAGTGTIADAPYLALLLSERTERRCERTRAKRNYKFAALVHSMSLSALIRNDSGIMRPNALAALLLITNSKVVGCSTGRSAGLAPLKILST